MTSNQLRYWELQEQKRANIVKEGQADRLNSAQIERWSHQNATDTANAVTGGIQSIGSALFGKQGLVGTITGLVGGAGKALAGAIGF